MPEVLADQNAVHLVIKQGATFTMRVSLKNPDGSAMSLTGYSARMQLRERHESPTAAVSLTSPSGGLVINAAGGYVDVTISATLTGALALRRYVWDLELDNTTSVLRPVQGTATVDPEVTR
jgi:hypothetical protein